MELLLSKKFSRKAISIIQLAVISIVLVPVMSSIMISKSFRKVAMRTFFKDCLLNAHARVYDKETLSLKECASKCIHDGTCIMFCFNEGNEQCITSTVYSSDWFLGIPEGSTTVTYDVCYSSWASSESIVRDTMRTTSSGPYNNQRVKELAIDGYYCHASGYEARRFDAYIRVNNFLQLDLGAVVAVREIRVAHHLNPPTFKAVTIRFGPSATSTSNQIIADLEYGNPIGDLRILLDPPVEGRYLHFLSAVEFYFSIGEIQVLPAI